MTPEEQKALAYRVRQQRYADLRLAREVKMAGSTAAFKALFAQYAPLLPDPGWDPVEKVIELDHLYRERQRAVGND